MQSAFQLKPPIADFLVADNRFERKTKEKTKMKTFFLQEN
jgi:hypothetical protein